MSTHANIAGNHHTKDDFIAQIQTAETKAEEFVHKAEQKKRVDLTDLHETLTAEFETELAAEREASKKELEKAGLASRAEYETQVKEGEKASADMVANKMGVVEKLLPQAAEFLSSKF